MENLKEKLNAVQDYYKVEGIFPDAKQRKLRDYKDILEEHSPTSHLINDAYKGKINLVDEVNKLWEEAVTKKYKGFLNFWKPHRALDLEFNRQIEDFEKALSYESKNMKTGGNKPKQIAGYIEKELLSDIILFGCLGLSIGIAIHPMGEAPDALLNMIKWTDVIGLSCIGPLAKYKISPQMKNRRLRKEDFRNMKKNAEFIQSIIDEVIQNKG